MNLDILAVSRKPIPNLPVLVVGGVVLDQINFARKIASHYPLQVDNVGRSIEDFLEMVEETGSIELDCAKDF